MIPEEQFKLLERRLGALTTDSVIISLCSVAIYLCVSPLFEINDSRIWMSAVSILAAMAVLEFFTGLTPGKLCFGLKLQTPEGSGFPVHRAMIRGGLRLLPVIVFLLSLLIHNSLLQLAGIGVSLTLAVAYFPLCYITLVRFGRTIFDLAAGSIVVQRRA